MNKNLKNLCLAALFVALGLLLPFLTGNIPQIGKLLSPMHIPIMLCGLICGWKYGLAVGAATPVLRSLLFGMPTPLYPNALGMSFELAGYAVSIALIYRLFKKKTVLSVYCAMIPSMLIGRIIWGISRAIMLGLSGPQTAAFSISIFVTSGFINAVPAIILQLIVVPAVMGALWRAHIIER